VDHVGLRELPQALDRKMRCAADARRAEVEQPRLRARELDELLEARRFHRRVRDEQQAASSFRRCAPFVQIARERSAHVRLYTSGSARIAVV
jgi:hypothetical protein